MAVAATIAALPVGSYGQAVEQPGASVGRALQQPFRDLNIVRSRTAPVLQQALADPYDTKGLDDCSSIATHLDELAAVLGPDVNSPREGSSAASELAAGAVGSLVDLPFSGVIRHLSGAYDQDLVHRRAVLAGMVRRGYLNGIWRTMGCGQAPTLAQAAPVPDTAPVAVRAPEPPPVAEPAIKEPPPEDPGPIDLALPGRGAS